MIQFFPVLAIVDVVWAVFAAFAWAAAVSYGTYLIAGMFKKDAKQAGARKIGGYPLQDSQKGRPVPIVYGCERVAGNIIWLGEQNWYEKKIDIPHVHDPVRVGTYRRSFLIGIAEGPGSVTKIWKGKYLMWSVETGSTGRLEKYEQKHTFGPAPTTDPGTSPKKGTILFSNGGGRQDARWFTDEDFGKYDDLIWCYFEFFETGSTPAIPDFTFEITNNSTRWLTTFIANGTAFDILDADLNLSTTVPDPVAGCHSIDINSKTGEVATQDNTLVYRYQADGTIDSTHYVPTGGWPGNMDTVLCGVRYTFNGLYLYVGIKLVSGSNHMILYKFDVTTGDELWNYVDVWCGWGISVDSNDNCYVRGEAHLIQVLPDGTLGTEYDPPAEELFWLMSRDILADEDDNLLLACGSSDLGADGRGKLTAYDLETGEWLWSYKQLGADKTAGIVYGIANYQNEIFVCGDSNAIHVSGDPTATVWKFDTAGNLLARYDTGGNAGYCWIDYLGRLIVKDDTQNELHALDPVDLSLIEIYPYNVILTPGQEGINVPRAVLVAPCGDVNPAVIIKDLATHVRYGAGISESSYINTASFLTETMYWDAQEMLISLSVNEQMPFMDWVDFILSHCIGYRFWAEGKFNIGAFKDEASIASLTTDDFVRDEGENPPPPVSIIKRRPKDTFNRVDLSWTDRANTYDLSVTMQQDEVDQRVSGKVRINSADLTGIHVPAYAQKMALRLLFESMYRFSVYTFNVSYKRMLLQVGDVIDVTDGYFLTAQKMRIIAREEDKDGRFISIEAGEDVEGLYPSVEYIAQQTLAVPGTQVSVNDLVDGTLAFREHLTSGMLFISFAPKDIYTDAADLYRSFDGINYEFVGRMTTGLNGDKNVSGTLTSSLPRAKAVMHRYSESFTADVGSLIAMQTDITDEQFFNNENMAKIGDEIMAWKTAEDQGSGIWKITNVIRGLFGTEAIDHPVGATFATISPIDFYYPFTKEVAGQVLYFKALPTSGQFVGKSLDDVAAVEYTVISEHERPAPLSAQRIKNSGGLCTVNSFPVIISFNLASKISGFNKGGKGQPGWGNFVKDDRIIGINVTLKTITGTQISFEYHDLDGYHADDYELTITEADRLGNDPVIVELEPVTSLPSSKATANMIDVVP